MTFGSTLKKLREEMNLTQEKLGIHLNLKQQEVSYLENGNREPNLNTLIAISKFFNVSTDYLLGVSYQKNNTEPIDKDLYELATLYKSLNNTERHIIRKIIHVLHDTYDKK